MLSVFIGTDRKKTRTALNAAVGKMGGTVVRITDAHPLQDLEAALRGRGMFDGKQAFVLDGCFGNDEKRALLERRLKTLAESEEPYFIIEETLDTPMRRALEKRARETVVHDAPKGKKEDRFFALTSAFRSGKKKDLWILLQREYAAGKAPEALHGSFFWAAKQMVLKPRVASEATRGAAFVAALAALPHEARRRGEELEYALERFVLSRP